MYIFVVTAKPYMFKKLVIQHCQGLYFYNNEGIQWYLEI